jgi:hypothetical protein
MANAKKCDICGDYYDVPDISPCLSDHELFVNMIRLHRAKETDDNSYSGEYWTHFDACPRCYQDVMDYILSKKVDAEKDI